MNGRELSTYSDGTNNISYKYNLNGIRTSKIVNGIKTNYILEGTSIIFEDRNGTMIYYIYNGDELLGFIYNSKTYYYHKNIFGDIIGILDSNYNEIVSYEYDSWGALVNITDNSNINLGTINPFRYRSYYYDTETQLYYLNSRYYNPQIGRFINADGIIASNDDYISNNLFTYVNNNFVNKVDRSGESFAGVLGGITAKKIIELALEAIGVAVSVGIMSFMGIGGKLEATEADLTQAMPKKTNYKDPNKTYIYRYNGTNPGNFVPTWNDVNKNSGLSFNLVPKPGAAEFAIEDLIATGLFRVEMDGVTHVTVYPRLITVNEWRILGTNSFETMTLKRLSRKWDGQK